MTMQRRQLLSLLGATASLPWVTGLSGCGFQLRRARPMAFQSIQLKGFEASCFDGEYITGDVSAEDFAAIESQRLTQKDEEDATNSRLALQNRAD